MIHYSQGFHKWKRNVNHIWQVLLYARRSFYKIEVNNPLNMEAASLYEKDQEEFRARARSCVMDWKEALYSVREHPDPSYLIFSPYEAELHAPVREQMKRGAEEIEEQQGAGARTGKSYVATGSLTIFSENILPGAKSEGPRSMPK